MHPGNVILLALTAYAIPGILFALAFVWHGAGTLDPVARGAPMRVRLLFAPGAAALWPLLLTRWIRSRRHTANGAEA
ncbi:MAG: hypothetical protein DHS20C14_12120 [Phycisphaeraceae bacterium]|nr:MAG: hypothetical protein DHS20C14_12120 [Phycisphaeraceae bacterium]